MSKFAGLRLAIDAPGRMPIKHPRTGQPIKDKEGREAFVEVYSADSALADNHRRETARRRLASRVTEPMTPEEMRADADALLAAITAGWHLVDLEGEAIDVPFTQNDARELYAEQALFWIRTQVDEFAANRANFTKASSPT